MHASRLGRTIAASLAVSTLTLGLNGCSGGGSTATPPASAKASAVSALTTLLDTARNTLDTAKAVHFSLVSGNVPKGGNRLIGGLGSMTRPTPATGAFQGDMAVTVSGNKVTIALTSIGGKVYIKLPFSAKYQITDPSGFGLSDPAKLIVSKTGIAQLFFQLSDIKDLGEHRVGGEVVHQVRGTVPGLLVGQLLTSADPNQPVEVKLSIVPGSGQLRQAVMTGPFFVKGTDSTYTVTLDRYDEKVTIKAPAV